MQRVVGVKITLIGVGSGSARDLTQQAMQRIQEANCLIGAKRLLESLPDTEGKERIAAARPEEIIRALKGQTAPAVAVLFSGDSGFYSGCRGLLPLLREHGFTAEVLPGLSSIQLLAAALGRPWQDWVLVSAHGVDCNPLPAVMQGKPACFLTGGRFGPTELCALLTEAGLGDLAVTVGEDLGHPMQRITSMPASRAANESFSPLSVLLAEPAPLGPQRVPGWPDSWFVRGQVPMTKQMVRSAVLSMLAPKSDGVIWDIGAGTGGVSIELAAAARQGTVYAVECNQEACALIRQNRTKFCAWNLRLAAGTAPAILRELPPPDAVFIGGTKGQMEAVVETVLRKNSKARICISAIALETVGAAMAALRQHGIAPDVMQLSVSAGHPTGHLHLLMANNPVFLIAGNCDD